MRDQRIVVISDTHFGDRTELLNDAFLVDSLMSALGARGPVDELVILGDLLDLWVRNTVEALRQARYFLESVTRLPGLKRVVYVPGNHDHKMLMDAFTRELDASLSTGDLRLPVFRSALHYKDTILEGLREPGTSVPVVMDYPFIVREVNSSEVLITHGHHLDFYKSRLDWARTFGLGRSVTESREGAPDLRDIEMTVMSFCGAMSMAPWSPELVTSGLRFYRVIEHFQRLFRRDSMRRSPKRDTLIRENFDEIAGIMPLMGHPGARCFVFGHTHRAGLGKIPGSGVTVANSGCWVSGEPEKVPTRTWLELAHDVKLYRLKGDGAELMYSERI